MRIEIVQSIKATTYNTLRRVLTLSLALAIFISHTPAQARFLQEDPVWFDAGDLNVYRYTGNNPVNRTDPSGMTAERAGLNVIALGAAAGLTLHGSQTILISLMVLQGSHYVLQEVAKTVNVEGKGLGCLIGLQLSSIGATILGADAVSVSADGCSIVASMPDTDDCPEKIREAFEICNGLFLGGKNRNKRLFGPNPNSPSLCSKGYIPERCGGNPIDWGGRKNKR